MSAKTKMLTMLLAASMVLASCGGANLGSIVEGPTPVPGAGDVPVPTAEVRLRLHPPEGTPAGAEIALEIVDTVTGVGYNSRQSPMTRLEDGTWEARTTLPLGTLLRYRYLQTGAENDYEETAYGERVRYRLLHVSGTMEIEDTAAAWTSGEYSGATGRIMGRVLDSGSGQPVSQMIISAGGRTTFTDGQGRFRLEGLPPGLHNLVAYHPQGAYRTAQQGAILAANSTTPAEFSVRPAAPVTLTFQVSVPAGSPADQPVRMTGNVLQLGATFTPLGGGLEVSPARSIDTVWVDETHRLALVGLYAGTDLRYKYTLGGGFWSAERDGQGAFRTRQLIVPETDAILNDQVASWGAGNEPVRFELTLPQSTPPEDEIGLQLNPFTWFEPLPLTRAEDDHWSFELHGASRMAETLDYRYCRNLECGRADEEDNRVRSVDLSGDNLKQDTIEAWEFWGPEPASAQIDAPEIAVRSDFEAGVEMAPIYRPSWTRYDSQSMARVAQLGSNVVTLTPSWSVAGTRELPLIEFDPTAARFESELQSAIAAARRQELEVQIRPELAVPPGWWSAGERGGNWWGMFFEELESFLVSQAISAQANGADKLVVTGSQLIPALPGGGMPDGQLSGLPADADGRWRSLIEAMRAEYRGPIAYEVELSDDLTAIPSFLDLFDEIHVYWHAPLAADPAASDPDLQQEAQRFLELEVLSALPSEIPVVLSVEYLSIERSLSACPPAPNGGCRPAADFDAGAGLDGEQVIDMAAQSRALNAVLMVAAASDRVKGFHARRFNPLTGLHDGSASVYGKPAANVLSYWYPRIQGETAAP